MSGEMEFDFTDAELFAAFRLVVSDAEARQQTDAVRGALRPGMDWGASHDLLLLLSIASETGREKADRIRKEGQESRIAVSIRNAAGPATLSDDELGRRVREAVFAEDRRWQEQRAERRRELREEGRQLPDEP